MQHASTTPATIRSRRGRAVCLGAALALLAAAGEAAAAVCRVTPTGTASASGSDWAGEALTLPAALADANCGEIWVQAGIYTPGATAQDSFRVEPGRALYGGFAGGESVRAARDPASRDSILSGDIDANDLRTAAGITASADDIRGSNSTHVVIVDGNAAPVLADTVLDGFVITAGDAAGGEGGGLLCRTLASGGAHCSPSLRRLRFRGNRATYGGGLYIRGVAGASSEPRLEAVEFSGNEATNSGGAIYNDGNAGNASPSIRGALFHGNHAYSAGGAITNAGLGSGRSTPLLVNVTFAANSAKYGGAMFSTGNNGGAADPVVINATFIDNAADMSGNALRTEGSNGHAHALLRNVIIQGDAWGDAVVNASATTAIRYGILPAGCPAGTSCLGVTVSDALLGPLQDNGGYTATALPDPWSPAIDRIACSEAPFRDQRDAPRPDPLSAGLATRCDLGAAEADSTPGDALFADGFGAPPLRK